MSIPYLINANPMIGDDLTHPYSDMELLCEARSQLFGELDGLRGKQIDFLCHPLGLAISVDGMGAKNDDVGTTH